ncbi:hypothetical protein [Streptomyces sp. NPDC002209]|uniref:hypothetical protein n=1 Tax=Streptomyces sp. NPDC002209 TaxID=3364638 RepID=UPI00369F5977
MPTRSARASRREAIRTSRRSRASSTLADSRCRTVASSAAVFRVSSNSRSVGAFDPIPYRASPAIRAIGTTSSFPAHSSPALNFTHGMINVTYRRRPARS